MAKHIIYYKGEGDGFPQARAMVSVRNYCTPSPLRYALTIKKPVGSGTTM
jgi:hypothetical protein